MSQGYIRLHRKIQDCWVWDDRPYSKGQAWIDLLLLANYKDRKEPYGNEIRNFQRGTVNLSQMQLANRWGWDRRTVKRFLMLLESDNMITQESTTHGTTITLVNYDKFNDYGTTNITSDGTTEGTTEGTTDAQPIVQPAPTTKKYNKVKESKEGNNTPLNPPKGRRKKKEFIPPTLEEVKAYAESRGNIVDPTEFFDYFEAGDWIDSQGKPVVCWKQKYVTWEQKRKEKIEQQEKKQDDSEWGHII